MEVPLLLWEEVTKGQTRKVRTRSDRKGSTLGVNGTSETRKRFWVRSNVHTLLHSLCNVHSLNHLHSLNH